MLQCAGETDKMNLCQAVTNAMDIAMEKDPSSGEIMYLIPSLADLRCAPLTGRSRAALATKRSSQFDYLSFVFCTGQASTGVQ